MKKFLAMLICGVIVMSGAIGCTKEKPKDKPKEGEKAKDEKKDEKKPA